MLLLWCKSFDSNTKRFDVHFPEWYMLLFHPLFWAALAIAIVGGIGLVAYAIWREKRKSRSDGLSVGY